MTIDIEELRRLHAEAWESGSAQAKLDGWFPVLLDELEALRFENARLQEDRNGWRDSANARLMAADAIERSWGNEQAREAIPEWAGMGVG